MKALLFLSAIALVLVGCAGVPQQASSAGSHSWRLERFTVSFTAGQEHRDRDGDQPKSGSFYEITPLRLGAAGRFRAESWQSSKSLRSQADVLRWIKVTEDPAAESLVIHENVPNDCCPCSNYVWVRPSGGDAFPYSYLQIPERPIKGSTSVDFGSEFPDILSLRDGILTYRYPHGGKFSVKIGTLPQKKEPKQPG